MRERTNYKREREQVGMEGSNKILTGKKEAAGRGGCLLQVREHVFSIYKRRRRGVWRNILTCVLAPLCPVQHWHLAPCAYLCLC